MGFGHTGQTSNLTLKKQKLELEPKTEINLAEVMSFNGPNKVIIEMLDPKSIAKLTQVNKHFCNISNQSKKAVIELDLNQIDTNINDDSLAKLLKQYPNLKKLDLRMCVHITDEGLKAIASTCSQLTNLNLACTQVTDEGLNALATSCPQLINLDLSGTKVPDEGLKAIAAKYTQLTALDLVHTKVTDV